MARHVRGGRKLKAWVAQAKRNARDTRKRVVEVGYFDDARYPDGTPVAFVALLNEYGLGGRTERPFFRGALARSDDDMARAVREHTDGKRFDALPGLEAAGERLAEEVRASVEHWRDHGGRSALVETGRLRDSVESRMRERII